MKLSHVISLFFHEKSSPHRVFYNERDKLWEFRFGKHKILYSMCTKDDSIKLLDQLEKEELEKVI